MFHAQGLIICMIRLALIFIVNPRTYPELRHSPERTSIDLDTHESAATLYDSPDDIPKPSFGA